MRRAESVGEHSPTLLVSIEPNVAASKTNNAPWIRFAICRVCKDTGIAVESTTKDNIKNELAITPGTHKQNNKRVNL
ncbi:hypothetical protein BEST7613_5561 [Synechocystis sp. PCC 6803]|nr:hypothetical protein BEST7613_5561 [Synechocystis sp. PCC 6803] [Bacillus subtilis BEST7613]